ncbi:YchJ family protein [Streptomyces cacaoi]|uniref:UPF0225 protein SCA03_01020 n=2 Tax=Streptomyces cacaoi TaxID=1898 RepID=A0A4Y3QQS4_STRCI|nr:YchJ family metal-binding protein [Streptomyces cacaoi]GEB47551.1 UPF0225 protein [Streptomyces cacaoi]
MSSRKSGRRPRPGARTAPPGPPGPCPCGSGTPFGDCCGRAHGGRPAATAEALMRSRYSAFVVGDAGYLLRTWHPATRPARLDVEGTADGPRWTGLEILTTTGGSAFHAEGTVAFRAHYTTADGPGVQEEHSRFLRHEGLWVYHSAL